jgi:DMSO/TMAO reductase YedYZ molybdopterin-dependent catalytic subunit
VAFCEAGYDYAPNLPIEDLTRGKAWIAYEFDGAPLEPTTAAPPACS